MIEREELAAWLRLTETPGVGRESARKLLAAFGSAQAIFDTAKHTWREVISHTATQALGQPSTQAFNTLLEGTWDWLNANTRMACARTLICLGDPTYPATWLQISDPPLMLYAQGRLDLLQAPSIAVVGSRNPTRQGLDNARSFAQHFSQSGLTVVSGLASGIDGAAHEGALMGSASTIAIVGTGLNRVYPKQHLPLAHRIAEEGLMLSEFSLGTPPMPHHFPQRNRLIAGLTLGTLVVEAALQSGSLITANMAVEAGRDVFAIPGSIHAPQSRGCHALIKQGAKLVDSAQDILSELRLPSNPPTGATQATPQAAEDRLLEALGYDPMPLDTLCARTGWPPQAVQTRLLELELDGRIARLAGGLLQRIETS